MLKKINSDMEKYVYLCKLKYKIRNKIKRQITAILDNLSIDLNKNTDVFIIARPKVVELSYNDMLKQLEYLLKKHKIIQGEKND